MGTSPLQQSFHTNSEGVQQNQRRRMFGPFRVGCYAGDTNAVRGSHPRLFRWFPFGERGGQPRWALFPLAVFPCSRARGGTPVTGNKWRAVLGLDC
jgi:hypothetical protein